MAPLTENLVCPPLPIGADGLRLFSLQSGNFYDPIVCTLTAVAFSSKPKYVALSYIWGDSYSDSSQLPTSPLSGAFRKRPSAVLLNAPEVLKPPTPSERTSKPLIPLDLAEIPLPMARSLTPSTTAPVTVNGHGFQVHHNLHLALLHLRSPTHQ